ncbi:hypothetical protein ACK1LH_10020 [Metabacillus indicus]|uniref:hypothetical protein n=1 Tax=Metabacillus indicus TaxID=246786 RepID=UPI003983FD9E
MPYHKNKQQAFQAAQQGTAQAENMYQQLSAETPDYGIQLIHLKEEINEAYEQINNALEVASETQRETLEQYRRDLSKIVAEVNIEEQ